MTFGFRLTRRGAMRPWFWMAVVLAGSFHFSTAGAADYREAPVLAARSRTGEIPPVAERMPAKPVVVQPVNRIGKYGGSWRTMYTNLPDLQLTTRMGYETLMRWDRDAKTVIPGIASAVTVSDDATTYSFKLRPGMRWSDGHPFTSADFVFFRDRVLLNKELTPTVPAYLKMDGALYDLATPDAYTVVFKFKKPYGMFLQVLAYNGRQYFLFAPEHYGKRFHADFRNAPELAAEAKTAGFGDWAAYFFAKNDLNLTAGCPSVAAYVLKVPYPAQRCVASRNPYYWKVDPDGNQLPYIDEVIYDRVLDGTMLNVRTLEGQADFQNRGVDTSSYTLLKEASASKRFHVQADVATANIGIYVNQASRDERHRAVLQDRRFRLALSLAINRKEALELIYNGLGVIDNGTTQPEDLYYVPGLEQSHTEYDPSQANRILDELGFKRAADGMRVWPDGGRFFEVLHIFPSEGGTSADLWELLTAYWREVGLQFTPTIEEVGLSRLNVVSGFSDFFGYRCLTQHWQIDGSFKVPVVDYCYHAPLNGRYIMTEGKQGIAPAPEQQRLIDWYTSMVSAPGEASRIELGQKILKQSAEQQYFIGICRPMEVTVISDRFHNVPSKLQHNFRLMSPGYIGIEQFYIDPDEAPAPASDAPAPRYEHGAKGPG